MPSKPITAWGLVGVDRSKIWFYRSQRASHRQYEPDCVCYHCTVARIVERIAPVLRKLKRLERENADARR